MYERQGTNISEKPNCNRVTKYVGSYEKLALDGTEVCTRDLAYRTRYSTIIFHLTFPINN